MSTVGYGVGAALGLATEGTYGTAESSADLWLPFTSEDIKAARAVVPSATIYGDRSVRKQNVGVRTGAGGFSMEVDFVNMGLPLFYWNGNASGGVTSAAIPGRISSAPGGTPGGTGATIPTGTYRYKVASVWQKATDSTLYVLPASAELTGVAVTLGEEVVLTWTNPATLTPPAGYTYYGTAVYRTSAGGAADSETLKHIVVGSGTGYTDTGGSYNVTDVNVAPVQGVTLYQHTFVKAFTAGENPLPGFTTFVVKDNDVTERYIGCRMNTLELSVGPDLNSVVTAKFGLMARDFDTLANPSPSVSDVRKAMSWQGQVAVDGTYAEFIEGFTLSGSNNCEQIPGLSNLPRFRDVGYGMRQINGTLGRGFENHDFFDIMYAGSRFDIRAYLEGAVIDEDNCSFTAPGGAVGPFRYSSIVDVFNCSLSEAGANVGGPGRMVENINWGAEVDDAEATELRIRLYNLTASYA
ncbi:hypothetical protein DYH09_23520 [bacterium CPR1]|nr:hypothetical protein [bacterium CPR1]